MKARSPIRKISEKRRKALGDKPVFSTITSPKKPVRKENPVAKAKRIARYRKMLAGKEYKVARAEAFERAGGRCEYLSPNWWIERCPETEALHAHHLRYPKSRPLEARDLKILCKNHHELAESEKPHKSRMF